MTKAVIIGASEEALHTIKKAHEQGLWVIALDGNPGAAGLDVADKAVVVDISDEAAVISAVRKENADFVLTAPIGRYLTTIGAVNDALGLSGIGKEAARLCTDKYSFHKRLNEKNLRNCHCYLAEERVAAQVLSGEAPLSFPAILKPRFGSGSRGIYLAKDAAELQAALRKVGNEPYVLEECVEGEEYGVDGAVINGSFQMVLLRGKKNTPLPARQATAYFSIQHADSFRQQVNGYMVSIIECLNLNDCLLHADIIRTCNGPFVIELSARPSGHSLHNIFTPLCTGVDMAEEYIKYRMGKTFSFTPMETKSMMIHYFDMHGKVGTVPDKSSVENGIHNNKYGGKTGTDISLVRWECNINEGEELMQVSDGHSIMSRGYFILEGKNTDEMLALADEINSGMMLN